MKLNVRRVTVWATVVKDSPGALAEKLAALTSAGADLGFIVARRNHKKRGTSVVFVTPITGAAQARAARKLGFKKTDSLHSVRADGPDDDGFARAALAEQTRPGRQAHRHPRGRRHQPSRPVGRRGGQAVRPLPRLRPRPRRHQGHPTAQTSIMTPGGIPQCRRPERKTE